VSRRRRTGGGRQWADDAEGRWVVDGLSHYERRLVGVELEPARGRRGVLGAGPVRHLYERTHGGLLGEPLRLRTRRRRQSPFRVTVGLSHSGTGLEKVEKGQVDIADSSAPAEDEFPDASQEKLDKYVDHVVGVDGQPLVVSKAIRDAGVTKLTGEQIRAIYQGEITNWTEIDAYSGPDKEIQAVGRSEGSGTDTAFRANLLGDPDASMSGTDVRKGQNQQVKTLVNNSDNAIAYLALAFVDADGGVPPIGVEIDGTLYEYGKNLGAKGYPLSRDLHCYTWEGTSKKEAAFLNMLLSEYGQQNFVAANNYFTLPPDRRREERDKLPEQA